MVLLRLSSLYRGRNIWNIRARNSRGLCTHMLAQSWPNFKNLESLHSTVLYGKNTKKSLPFPFFGIFKMSIQAIMRRESFSDSCANTCRKWPLIPFTQNLKYPMRTVYKVCAFCPNLRHPRASYPQDSDKRLFLIPLLTACSAQNLHVFIVLSTLAPLCFGFLQQCVVLIVF